MSEPVAIHILDREYLVACEPEERASLLHAASLVDGRMRELRNSARSATIDRIAVLVALNLAHELLGVKNEATQSDGTMSAELDTLKARLEATLAAYTPR
jgi:cell division protein ZapA